MKKIKILIALGVLSAGVFAQTKDSASFSFSLKQAVDYALQNQRDIKNAMIDEAMAKAKVKEITGMGLPQINSSFDVKDFLDVPTTVMPNFISPAIYAALVQANSAPYDETKMTPDGYAPMAIKFGSKYQSSYSLEASQLIFSGDYFLGLKASKVFVELSSKSLDRTKIETTVAVSKAYYTVLVGQERMKLMDANVNRLKKTMDDTKALLDNGFVEKIDYDRLSVAYTNLLVEQEKVKRLLELGTYLLKYQMGMDVNANLVLTDKLSDMKTDITSSASAQKFDYSKRVEYGLFEDQYRLAQLDLKRNRFSYLPNAFAYASTGRNAQSNKFDLFGSNAIWYPTSLVGATVKLPIFSGLQRNYKNQQAKLAVQKAENNMDFIKKSIDLELASSLTILQNATASLENQKKNMSVAEDVVRVAKLKYDQGVGSNLELITAETALKEAQTNYYNALFDALVAKIDYDKANGNLK